MEIQQPNLATFSKADYKLFQQMNDNDDMIKAHLETMPKGVVSLAVLNNTTSTKKNYSNVEGFGYAQWSNVDWIDAEFVNPNNDKITINFESNRYYKFIIHLDYVWAANVLATAPAAGHSGRMEIRLRDMTHRHDLIYWTNIVSPDYNMGGIQSTYYALKDINNLANVNIWAWDQEASRGCVPSSCHAVRVLPAKTSGAAVLKLQYRPMNAYGGIVPPELMDCTSNRPAFGLPTQYQVNSGTFNTEPVKEFNGYVVVEDCGPTEKPAGVQPGVFDDNSSSPLYEAYENHPYNSTTPELP